MLECGTPQEAVALISERRLLPAGLKIWRADAPLVEIAFEDLQQMAGHDPLDVKRVEDSLELLLHKLWAMLKDMGLYLDVYSPHERVISTSGIPSGHPSVDKMFGNPCVRVRLRLTQYLRDDGEPRTVPPSVLTDLVAKAAENPAMLGWAMLHSSCSVVMRIPNVRPFREIEMYLSRPRAMFDEIEEVADGQ